MKRLLSCEFNMDTACVELKFANGSMIAIDTIAVENEVADNIYQRSELDWLIYNDPAAHAGRHFYRGEAGYCEKQAPGFLSPGYSETCAVAFLSEWSALPGGHPYLAGIYRLLPDSLQ